MGDHPGEIIIGFVELARDLIKELDIGDCDSGGDYHSSRLGRHCDANGGKDTCPVCRLRAEIRNAGYKP